MTSYLRLVQLYLLASLSVCIFGCVTVAEASLEAPKIRFDYSAKQITKICTKARAKLVHRLTKIEEIPASRRNFRNTARKFDTALAKFVNKSDPVVFLKYVSTSESQRTAAGTCEEEYEKIMVEVFGREKLYAALKSLEGQIQALEADEKALLKKFLSSFERNGLGLAKEQREIFTQKKKLLIEKTSAFSKRLNEWQDSLLLSKADLEGLSESFVGSLAKEGEGYRITLAYPHYYPFMENAKNAEAREKLYRKFTNRGGAENTKLLEEAITLRHELATMLGFESHAAFVLDDRMAENPAKVLEFLSSLRSKLKVLGERDLEAMKVLKREETGAQEVTINGWDWRYYENQIKKKNFQIDPEEVKQYFPLDVVNSGMFEIYQTLLGVTFEKTTDIPTWHKSVQAYAVKENDQVVAYFYLDLFPRPNKYGHAAAFTLNKGFAKKSGGYNIPISSVVANFNAPTEKLPSLLSHSQVNTHFHEFGHIMHQVLTKARFATLSGTSVKRDFVEAPSQMLENWVWKKDSLAKLSGHYKNPAQKLPNKLLQRMLDAKLANVGIRYLRQLFFATLDMTYHTSASAESTKIYSELIKDIMLIPIPEGVQPQASFGHLMGGYDAGYYGYLWSEVFAQDMFTRFDSEGLFNPGTGKDYRNWILEPGGTKSPMELITGFLGREPNQEAFLKSLGLGE